MADQYRRGNEDDYRQQGGRGWTDRAGDEMRTWFGDDDARARRQQDERQQFGNERDRAWRDQGDGSYERNRGGADRGQYSQGGQYPQYSQGSQYSHGGYSNQGSYRQPGGGQFGPDQSQYGPNHDHYGQYTGSQYGGASSYGRGYPESDFMPHRVGSSSRESEHRYGPSNEWRTSGSSGQDQSRWGGDSSWGSAGSYGRSQGAGSFGGGASARSDYNRGDSGRTDYGRGDNGGSSYGGNYGAGSNFRGGNSSTGSGADWSTGGYGGGDTSFEPRNSGWGGNQGQRESYSGRGPKGYQRSDDRIREDASDRLEQDHGVDASDISVQVQNGEVTLTGTVTSRDQKRRAEDCVEAISGVREVTNNLRVNRNDGRGQQAPASETSSSILGLGGQKSRESEGGSATQSANTGSSSGKQGENNKSGRSNSGTPGTSGTPGLSA